MKQNPTLDELLEQRRLLSRKQSLNELEQSFLAAICRELDDETVRTRLSYLLEWYTRKAQFNKFWYNCCRFVTYLIPCLITLVSVFGSVFDSDNSKWAILTTATLSAFLVAIHHVIDHYRFYENWVRYRDTAEKLKTETEYFLNHCEPYNKKDRQKNYLKFAARIEYFSSAELASWENLLDESYRTFQEENQAALQNSLHAVGSVSLNALDVEELSGDELSLGDEAAAPEALAAPEADGTPAPTEL